MRADPRSTETVSPDEAPLPSPSILPPGSQVAGRFRIERVLGSGGSSVVYLARDQELRLDVALKLLRADRVTPVSLRRFRREVAIARGASSPHLVRVFDIGEAPEGTFLTMELIRGGSLQGLLGTGPLPVDRAVSIAREVLRGLRVLHDLGIVHRDVKPGNVLITEGGEVKVGDFGLARHLEDRDSRLTRAESLVGTMAYISPEQALGRPLDPRSDLYSFGVLLFEMLTGRLPFDEQTSLSAAVAHVSQRPADLRAIRREVPTWLAGVVGRLLAKRAIDRYPSAAEVLDDLDQGRFRAPRNRRRARMIGGSLLALAAVAGSLVSRSWTRSRFTRLVEAPSGAYAVDAAGRTLWARTDLDLTHGIRWALARTPRGPRLAAVLTTGADLTDLTDLDKGLQLVFLDLQTGQVRERAALADGSARFTSRGFTRRYGVRQVVAVDLDGDGIDEVVVTYHHHPYWPSFTVVHDTKLERSWVAFLSSGNQVLAGAVDVDGDGLRELILVGPNNRMGWYTGIAAVRVPQLGGPKASPRELPGCSPDLEDPLTSEAAVAWYALGPLHRAGVEGRWMTFEPSRREMILEGSPGPFSLSFAGFHGSGSPAVLADRPSRRAEAHRALRDARRLGSIGSFPEALAEARRGAGAAVAAGDPYLAEWARRLQGGLLVGAGRHQEADDLFRSLAADSGARSQICYDAAKAYHLAGELGRAVDWYRRGLAGAETVMEGRAKVDFIEGEVLALGEMKRFQEARATLSRFTDAYPSEVSMVARHRQWLSWRESGAPGRAQEGLNDETDLSRYWALEFRAAEPGSSPETLLIELERLQRDSTETTALLTSLRAELLQRLDRGAEALDTARKALAQAREAALSEPAVRAHLPLVSERTQRMSGTGPSSPAPR